VQIVRFRTHDKTRYGVRVSEVMTLLPGDVVATGAPGASGPLVAGDRVEIRIDGIGGLKNTVVRL
jgi:2-keto-4-pentenoate hydratase/2-oxohepta-3-ene-1,7-dioic acid hydratase in catechol pathway